jgi:hypothetical protein
MSSNVKDIGKSAWYWLWIIIGKLFAMVATGADAMSNFANRLAGSLKPPTSTPPPASPPPT